jgi:hypothetical protein
VGASGAAGRALSAGQRTVAISHFIRLHGYRLDGRFIRDLTGQIKRNVDGRLTEDQGGPAFEDDTSQIGRRLKKRFGMGKETVDAGGAFIDVRRCLKTGQRQSCRLQPPKRA